MGGVRTPPPLWQIQGLAEVTPVGQQPALLLLMPDLLQMNPREVPALTYVDGSTPPSCGAAAGLSSWLGHVLRQGAELRQGNGRHRRVCHVCCRGVCRLLLCPRRGLHRRQLLLRSCMPLAALEGIAIAAI